MLKNKIFHGGLWWEVIDLDNLPKGEVLAANFNPLSKYYGEKLLGELKIERGMILVCYDVMAPKELGIMLVGCTHFINITDEEKS